MKELQGTVIITAQQLFDIARAAAETGARQAIEAMSAAGPAPKAEYLTAEEAAGELGYKTKAPLRKFHGKELKPVRRNGKRLFYASAEVAKLKNRLFNFSK